MEDQDKSKSKLSEWLDQLQLESWQLELLISGFAIFLMAGTLDALDEMNFMQELNDAGLKSRGAALGVGYLILTSACFFIMVNLVLHVLLRGLWISTLGLRYVSGDVDFEKLKLSPKFDAFLRRRIGSFDRYILRLENICSVVFAFTFLIVFMLVGVGLFFFFIIFTIHFIENGLKDILPETGAVTKTVKWAIRIFFIVFSLGGLTYFIDFVTLGWVKRRKWFSKVYFPIYRFFSFLTLSTLYRPIYYNLIDNKFGRRVGFLLVPYLVVLIFILSFKVRSHIWFPDDGGVTVLRKPYYDDLRLEGQRVPSGSLPSKYVKNGYLELFIKYYPWPDDNALKVICPDFRHSKEEGFGTDIVFVIDTSGGKPLNPSPPDSALLCLSQLYEISVGDSLFTSPKFYFHEHQNDSERGLLTVLDLNYLPRGPQEISVRKQKTSGLESDSLFWGDAFTIPFWIE